MRILADALGALQALAIATAFILLGLIAAADLPLPTSLAVSVVCGIAGGTLAARYWIDTVQRP